MGSNKIVASTAPLLSIHALEGLDPELRCLLLSQAEEGSESDIISRCVQHVLSQAATGTKQQEAAIRATQQLETAGQRVDEELHSEVVNCHEQLLATIESSEGVYTELIELDQNVSALNASIARMKLYSTQPAQLLKQRAQTLERLDDTLTLLSLIKKLGVLVRLFAAQFAQNLQDKGEFLNNVISLAIDLPRAAQLQKEIESLVESLAHFCEGLSSSSSNDLLRQSHHRPSSTIVDAVIVCHFPALNADIEWIRQNGKILLALTNDFLTSGLKERNHTSVMTACQVLLMYGGDDILIEYLRPLIEDCIHQTLNAFETQPILLALSACAAGPFETFGFRGVVGSELSGGSKDQEIPQRSAMKVWECLQKFMGQLAVGLKTSFTLDAVLEALSHDEEWFNNLHVADSEQKKNDLFLKLGQIIISNVSQSDLNVLPIATLYWLRSIKEFKSMFLRLTTTSATLRRFLVTDCPKLVAIFHASKCDVEDLWTAELRTRAIREPKAANPMVIGFGSLTKTTDDTSVPHMLSSLEQVINPIVKDYLGEAKTNIVNPVNLMFPIKSAPNEEASFNSPVKLPQLPTPADAKVFVNVIVAELNRAASASSLHSRVLSFVEESLILCATRLRDIRDIRAMTIEFPKTKSLPNVSVLPVATPGHHLNAKLFDFTQNLCSSLLMVFEIDNKKSRKEILLPGRSGHPFQVSLSPEYASLTKILQLLLALQETFLTNWFKSFQRYICEIQLNSLFSELDWCAMGTNIESHGEQTLHLINEVSAFMSREYCALLPAQSVAKYGMKLSKSIIQYFLSGCCLIKPMQLEAQKVSIASHITSLEVTLSGFFCPKLRELLPVESTALKAFRRLLFLENFNSESLSVVNLPCHIISLHLLSRLPPDMPGILEFTGQDRGQIILLILKSLLVEDEKTASSTVNEIRSNIRQIMELHTTVEGNAKSLELASENQAIVLFLRSEMGLHTINTPNQ